ncbi:MAG: TolC family protein [Vicinamibacterales bacterium]
MSRILPRRRVPSPRPSALPSPRLSPVRAAVTATPTARWLLAAALLLPAAPALAQSAAGGTPPLTLRAVPATEVQPGEVALTLEDAIARGLQHNLAAIAAEADVDDARGAQLRSLSTLLPHVSGDVRQTRQVVNLAAFGFTGFPGIPDVIGPFDVFDARVALHAPIFDLEGLRELQSSRADLQADRATLGQTRETVILVIGSLYLEAVTDRARADAAQAELETARTLLQVARDQQAAGVAAGIDVLRQQAQLEAATARQIATANTFEKQKLALARAIGLPAGQAFALASHPEYVAAPAVDPDAALATALASRHDLRAALARVAAARAERQAAGASRLPSVHVDADYGRLGTAAASTESTYTVGASVHVPIFDGGATRARGVEADADVRRREAELADLEAGVRFDVRTALLDIGAADARVHVASTQRDLAREELTQAGDRFRAGVASSIELARAQDAVAAADEQYIASVQAHILAKASLARAMGQVEARFVDLVGGRP